MKVKIGTRVQGIVNSEWINVETLGIRSWRERLKAAGIYARVTGAADNRDEFKVGT
jgi:hypothetical protein